MKNLISLHKLSSFVIVFVWLVNGLVCKILNFVPRHQQIVAEIMGQNYAMLLTKMIGISEIIMTIWILSRIKPRFCAITQIFVVLLMNVIEFVLVPELLLFGKINSILAMLFCLLVYFNAFVWNKK
jgi:hypothetical protein